MGGMRITLSFYGDTQLDRTLLRIQDGVSDARPVWDMIADDFVRFEARQFASQGAQASGGWSPLSPPYAAWKARHYPGAKILERTGALRDSLTSRPLAVEDLTEKRMVIGSDVGYGAFHQHGGGPLPRRRPVEFTESRRRQWVGWIADHILSRGAR